MSEYAPFGVRCIGIGNLLLRAICALVGLGRVLRFSCAEVGVGVMAGVLVLGGVAVVFLRARLRLVMLLNAVVVVGGVVGFMAGMLVRGCGCLMVAGLLRLLVVFMVSGLVVGGCRCGFVGGRWLVVGSWILILVVLSLFRDRRDKNPPI